MLLVTVDNNKHAFIKNRKIFANNALHDNFNIFK